MERYLPTYVAESIYDIDFIKLYAIGKRIILIDLDNTMIPYFVEVPSEELLTWQKTIKQIGFQIYIVSNNRGRRVMKFCESFPVDSYLHGANKPLIQRINRFIKLHQIELSQTIFIGDQIVTDIALANRLGIDSVLVRSINFEEQKWYTKINRLREKLILTKMKKTHPQIEQDIQQITRRKR